MDFIIDQIAVGSYEDAINLQVLQANDITAVLDLASEVSYSLPPSILRLKIPLEDRVPMKQEYIRLAVNWLRNAAEERRVLAFPDRSPLSCVTFMKFRAFPWRTLTA